MSLAIRLFLILAAMIAVLSAMVIRHADHRANGFEVILAMEPLDPRDLMLGYYSIIQTETHRLDMNELEGPKTQWRRGDRSFVTLTQTEDGSWRPVAVAKEQPSNGVFLQGRVRSVSRTHTWRDVEDPQTDAADPEAAPQPRREPVPGTERDVLSMAYNLEAYYAEADRARALDEMRKRRPIAPDRLPGAGRPRRHQGPGDRWRTADRSRAR
jgi:uncharacterized membrane-anchored protein